MFAKKREINVTIHQDLSCLVTINLKLTLWLILITPSNIVVVYLILFHGYMILFHVNGFISFF